MARWAHQLARQHLEAALPRRWAHVQRVASRAGRLSVRLDSPSADLLQSAASLHDVGYAPPLAETGFHPLDGARHLRAAAAPGRIVDLVALHSAAESEAAVLGLADQLADFTDERSLVRDLLWYCDMTVGPEGENMTFADRMAELRERYPPDHYVIRALDAGMPEREAAVRRAEEWIESVGLMGQV
jgi:hypothetical protein